MLKRLVIIDVMTIASLFILRVVAGAVAVEAHASQYLLVCTAMLALFLGFTKRRQEAILEEHDRRAESRARSRALLDPVPRPDGLDGHRRGDHQLRHLRDQLAVRSARRCSRRRPPVLYGIFRYLYLIYDREDTRSTAAILVEDPGMIFAGVSWVATAVVMLYAVD